jgi:hypothetical protein
LRLPNRLCADTRLASRFLSGTAGSLQN